LLNLTLAVLLGLLIGSFLNVVIYRWTREEDLSVVTPRSFCPACLHPIAAMDNIPVLSYILLRGRCRRCKARIPLRYPLVEIVTAVLFAAVSAQFGWTWEAAKFCVFGAINIALFFTDLEERILPDELTLGGAVAGVLFAFLTPVPPLLMPLLLPDGSSRRLESVGESLLSAVLLSGMFWMIGKLYQIVRKREGLGLGDVKMLAMTGAFLGIQHSLLTLVAASVAGSVLGLFYIWFARKDAQTYALPYGSFIALASLVVMWLPGVAS
jgi:leader peptidase (prepilin peptidase)/N-methyltransferase